MRHCSNTFQPKKYHPYSISNSPFTPSTSSAADVAAVVVVMVVVVVVADVFVIISELDKQDTLLLS